MKEYLKKSQPIFYNLINNEFSQKKVPHAFLLIGNNTNKPLNYLTMSLICDETLACMKCDNCKKVLADKYADIIKLNGKNGSIKKIDIEQIQNSFKKSSLEGRAKIYIIENIEFSTREAMNTLLKMLEEPIEGVYALFTAKNINRVLPTILSRCQVIDIKPESKEMIIEQLITEGLPANAANVISYLVSDIDEGRNLYDDKFEYMMIQVINFIEDLYFKRSNLLINTQTNLLKKYKERNDIKLFLNILLLALKDLFHVKHNQKVLFESYIELFKKVNVQTEVLIKQIELVLETIYSIEYNANVLLLMDSLMYKL